MKEMIRNIRKQPEEIRRYILHILTVMFAVILVLVWVYSLGTNSTNNDTQTKIGQDLKPFSALKDDMVGGYDSITQPNQNTSSTDVNTGADSNSDLRTQENNL
jgi:hypothetical protein